MPGTPAVGLGPSGVIFPSAYAALVACAAPAVMVVTVRLATKLMLASASPRNPNVATASRSSNVRSLDVVWRSHRMDISSSRIPHPSSVTCSSLLPPSRTVTVIDLDPASREFSSISFRAEAGRWITSPAATRLLSSSARSSADAAADVAAGVGGAESVSSFRCVSSRAATSAAACC